MIQVNVVDKAEMKALVVKVPQNGHEVRRGWRELQERIARLPGVKPGVGHVFVPEWQWADGVKELWVGVEVESLDGLQLPDGVEALTLPACSYAVVHVYGNRDTMQRAYGELDAWFGRSGYTRNTGEGSFSYEANSLHPVNPFDISADEIAWFDYHIHAPILSGPEVNKPAAPTDSVTGSDKLYLKHTRQPIHAEFSDLTGSQFRCVSAEKLRFENVNLYGLKITDANLSDLEIDGAQLGGAYIHSIGMPPAGHPAYDPNAVQRPLRFEHCDLNGSTFRHCQLVNVQLDDCDIRGLRINGVDISKLLEAYYASAADGEKEGIARS
ncbi:GyrI-like domain-containing protein [Paenibacillus chartarius]|uniref:GyrI-like domain-containing protein n=1 Tax=Paenibacillus chartarius TaxID=747481 RepID=A0ABV6DUT0_9BACL